MNVKKVEFFGFENFQHFHGKRQGVRRVVEERVGDDFSLVEMDVWAAEVHANRRRGGDEVHVVPARSQFLAELGGYNARTAVSGVTCESDAHSG